MTVLLNTSFQGMAVIAPAVASHPNQVPFTGVLTRVDEPSNNPPHGSQGKRVILPKAVAEQALSSLLLMAVDVKDDLAGHDVQQKIGLIKEADLVGNELHIKGFFYAADFPETIQRIQAEKNQLGFSYEAQVQIQSWDDDPLVISHCIFTGAAVLYKQQAAYTTTSLAAYAVQELPMSSEINETLSHLQEQVRALEQHVHELKDQTSIPLPPHSLYPLVKAHADQLHAVAEGLEKAGVGVDATRGHAKLVHALAHHLMAEAAQGRIPHAYAHEEVMPAAQAPSAAIPSTPLTSADATALHALKEELTALKLKLDEADRARFHGAVAPDRKTLTPEIRAILANSALGENSNSEHVAVALVDKVLKEKGSTIQQRIQTKLLMHANHQLQETP